MPYQTKINEIEMASYIVDLIKVYWFNERLIWFCAVEMEPFPSHYQLSKTVFHVIQTLLA
jgi:hypothetical protein